MISVAKSFESMNFTVCWRRRGGDILDELLKTFRRTEKREECTPKAGTEVVFTVVTPDITLRATRSRAERDACALGHQAGKTKENCPRRNGNAPPRGTVSSNCV